MKYPKLYCSTFFYLTFIFANQYEISARNDSTFNVNYLIISPDSFNVQALQLAEYRSLDNLLCGIVSLDSILALNTYSTPDSTLKEFIKKVWANNSVELLYAIILGDWEIIPPHSIPGSGLDSVLYYDNWYTTNLDSTAQIENEPYFSLGRIPVESINQLQQYIDRLIQYENQIPILPWQNRVIGIAGEGYIFPNCMFDNTTISMGEVVEDQGLEFVFISKCEASEYYKDMSIIIDGFTRGSVLTFFNGQSSYYQWENDSLLTFDNVHELEFWDYSPILLTNANRQYGFRDSLSSIAKKMFIESADGPISMFSATNLIVFSTGHTFNNVLISNIMSDEEGRIGDSFFETIDEYPSLLIQSFQLFGDPALKPQIIKNESQITEPFSFKLSVNDQQPFISIYPGEEWNYLEIPLSHYRSVFGDSSEEVSITQLTIIPYFVQDSVQNGSITIDDFSIGDSYYEDFESGIVDWNVDNQGNDLSLNLTDETPTASGNSLELQFDRSISDTVISTANITINSPLILTLSDTIGFWIKSGEVNLDVESPPATLPTEYQLSRPYPNPFNPTLTVEFYIPECSKVKISVFDVLGREIDVIVNEEFSRGHYKRRWDGCLFPSGIYFVNMNSNSYHKTEKVLLIK